MLIQNPKEDLKTLIDQGLIHPTAIIHPGVYLGYNSKVGERTEIKPGVVIAGGVKIGCHCLIAPNVSIIRGQKSWITNRYELENEFFETREYLIKPPTISNRVFIGANSVILFDIIVESVTIGALSFVNHVIELPGTYCGNPIKRISDISRLIPIIE